MWLFASRRSRLERAAARAFGLKNYAAAASALEELLGVVGGNPHTLHAIAICRQRMGEIEAALRAAGRGIAVDPRHSGCLKLLAEIQAARGEMDAARAHARRALCALKEDGGADREWILWARALLDEVHGCDG